MYRLAWHLVEHGYEISMPSAEYLLCGDGLQCSMICNARWTAMRDDLAGANWRWYYSSYLLDALCGGMVLLFGEDKMELPLKSGSFKEI